MRFVRAARSSDLPAGGRLAVAVGGQEVALFNVGGTIYAIEDRCPHELAPLNDGELCGTRLTCRWHHWTFELDPAQAPAAAAMPRITRFPVRVEAGVVYVGLPEPDPSEATSPGSAPGASIQPSD